MVDKDTASRLSDAVIPLSTLDPAADIDDLEPIGRLIGDGVRVVAVGESAHGAREFYRLRHRIVRYLVERMGFTALHWESGFPEGFLVDDYIQGRAQDRARVQLDGMTMHMGRCDEFGELIDWLRARNAAARPSGPDSSSVRFYGLDLPGSTAVIQPAIDVVAAYLESVDPGFASRLARLRELAAAFGPATESSESAKLTLVGTEVVCKYVAISASDRNELTGLLADAAARFDALRRAYVERSDADRYAVARQHLRVAARLDEQLRAVAALMSGDAAACEANIRDLTMAETVEWVLGREQRVVVLAHNGHIQRTPISTVAGMTPVDTLGVHLAHRLGEAYLPIGTTCGGGEIIVPRTITVDGSQVTELVIRDLPPAGGEVIDGVLDAGIGGLGLLDLRTLDTTSAAAIDAAGKMRVLDQACDIDARRAFDILIHVPRISLWTSETNASLPDLRE